MAVFLLVSFTQRDRLHTRLGAFEDPWLFNSSDNYSAHYLLIRDNPLVTASVKCYPRLCADRHFAVISQISL